MSFSPAVGFQNYALFNGSSPTTDAAGVMPELCYIPPSSDHVYANIGLYAIVPGSNLNMSSSVYFISFRELFKVNVTSEGSDSYNLSLNRAGVCYAKPSSGSSPYVPLNNTPGVLFQFNRTIYNITGSVSWLCNNSYGESKTGSMSVSLWPIIGRYIPAWLLSPPAWVFILLVVLVIFGIPIFALVILEVRRRSMNQNSNNGGHTIIIQNYKGGGKYGRS
jgi:hypothetical protein